MRFFVLPPTLESPRWILFQPNSETFPKKTSRLTARTYDRALRKLYTSAAHLASQNGGSFANEFIYR